VEEFHYSLFGLSLSSNLPIPGLPLWNSAVAPPEIQLRLGVAPDIDLLPQSERHSKKLTYVSVYTDDLGRPALRVWETLQGDFLHFVYSDATEFWLDRKGSIVWATWPDQLSLENATSYLLGPVLGFVLRLRGVVCLHASAVAFANRCVAFVGAAGAGKSTTAAAFARLGQAVVSDDIVGLIEREGRFFVLPAYPHLCLWPESVKMLYGSADALPRLVHDWDKRRLALGQDGTRFENRMLPLDAVYILGARLSAVGPEVNAISSSEALLSLVPNTYATNLLDRDMRATEFAVLSRLASSIPVRIVHPSDDPNRIEDLCRVIRADFETQNA
jgi:hypothetical protein